MTDQEHGIANTETSGTIGADAGVAANGEGDSEASGASSASAASGAPATGGAPTKPESTSKGVRILALVALLVVLAAVVSAVFLQAVYETNQTYERFEKASNDYIACEIAAGDMDEASNYLTIQARSFVVSRQMKYLNNYFWEVNVTMRRQHALETLEDLEEGESRHLKDAFEVSSELMSLEYYAMKLVCTAEGIVPGDNAAALKSIELNPEDAALSSEEQLALAREMMFSDEYMDRVSQIEGYVTFCKEELLERINDIQTESSETLRGLLLRQQVLTGVLFALVLLILVAIIALVLRPITAYIARIRKNEPLPNDGAYELRYLAQAYNEMYAENMKNHDALRKKAEHDHLTGLYNRSVFERLLNVYSDEPYALLLVDADYFKQINDSLGHDGGDAMLQKISGLLSHTFRATDYPCRIGGDEFAVIMTEMNESLKHVVSAKIQNVVDGLADTSDGLPPMTLSIGIAFNDGTMDGEQVFKHADNALYLVKEAGRNGHRFYDAQ